MAITFLPNLGTLSYNGVTFTSFVKSTLRGNPTLDEATRSVKFVDWYLELSTYITPEDNNESGNTNSALVNLRQKLSQPGKELIVSNRGFGDLIVNSARANSMFDCEWGPRPEIVTWLPTGSATTAFVEWKCHTRTLEPERKVPGGLFGVPVSIRGNEKAVLALTSDVNFDVDTDGYLVISATYTMEIPLTFNRLLPSQLIDCADDYLHNAIHPNIRGFERKTSRTLTPDRRKLTVKVMDAELPEALPDNCPMAKVKHSVSAQGAAGGIQGRNHSITGTIHVDRRKPRRLAWDRFAAILRQRLDIIRPRTPVAPLQAQVAGLLNSLSVPLNAMGVTNVAQNFLNQAGRLNPHGMLLMVGFSADEDVLGRDLNFSLQFKQVGAPIWSFFGTTALYTPPPYDHDTWRRTMTVPGLDGTPKPQSPRGSSGRRFVKQNDVVVDIGYSLEHDLRSSDANPANVNVAKGPKVFGD